MTSIDQTNRAGLDTSKAREQQTFDMPAGSDGQRHGTNDERGAGARFSSFGGERKSDKPADPQEAQSQARQDAFRSALNQAMARASASNLDLVTSADSEKNAIRQANAVELVEDGSRRILATYPMPWHVTEIAASTALPADNIRLTPELTARVAAIAERVAAAINAELRVSLAATPGGFRFDLGIGALFGQQIGASPLAGLSGMTISGTETSLSITLKAGKADFDPLLLAAAAQLAQTLGARFPRRSVTVDLFDGRKEDVAAIDDGAADRDGSTVAAVLSDLFASR